MIALKIVVSLFLIFLGCLWFHLERTFDNKEHIIVWMVPVAIALTTIVAIGAIWTNI